MSVQSSFNAALAGFGYLTGQNAAAVREKRQYKLQEKVADKAYTEASNKLPEVTKAVNEARRLYAQKKKAGIPADTREMRELQNKIIEAQTQYQKTANKVVDTATDLSNAKARYAQSSFNKTDEKAIGDIEAAKAQEDALVEQVYPRIEGTLQGSEVVASDWMNQPDRPVNKMDSIDRTGEESFKQYMNQINIGYNQKAALEQRFGLKRGNE